MEKIKTKNELPKKITNETSDSKLNYTKLQYKVLTAEGWGDVMDSGSLAGIMGYPIRGFAANNVGKYRIRTSYGWSDWVDDMSQELNAEGYPIIGIEFDDPDVKIGIHIKGGTWLPIASGEAGVMLPIDVLWVKKV